MELELTTLKKGALQIDSTLDTTLLLLQEEERLSSSPGNTPDNKILP